MTGLAWAQSVASIEMKTAAAMVEALARSTPLRQGFIEATVIMVTIETMLSFDGVLNVHSVPRLNCRSKFAVAIEALFGRGFVAQLVALGAVF